MQVRGGALLLLVLFIASVAPLFAVDDAAENKETGVDHSEPYLSPTNGLGSWIWAEKTFDGQTCQFWRTFEVPLKSTVTKARLVMTVDNEFTLYLDGRELGHGAEWRELFIFDITKLLTPGEHVLAVKAVNSFSSAGMLLGLSVVLADGRTIDLKSDENWRIVPNGVSRWEKAHEPANTWTAASIIAPLGGGPWWGQPVNVNWMPELLPIKIFFWQTGWFQISLITICGLVILISLRLMARLALHQKERRLLQQERARIAREIHDDIGARMTQLVLHGELAQRIVQDGSEAHSQLIQICEEARGLLSTMDEILWAVNPRRDTLRDFAAYVCKYAQDFLAPTKIQCLFEVDPDMAAAPFDLPLRRSLLMAIKETLNNAVKHSGASEVYLQIHWQGQRLEVVVRDNGKGFDLASANRERNGLTNMSQGMMGVGGNCLVTSQPGKGCRVEFKVPLKRSRQIFWARFWQGTRFPAFIHKLKHGSTVKPSPNFDPTQC